MYLAELKASCENMHLSEEEMKNLFEGIDQDGTGRISYMEFLAATLRHKIELNENRLKEAFDRMDVDHSGNIDASDLKTLLGEDHDPER